MEIYKVGGCVRDRLLGREISDRDWVVVGANAQQMEALGYRRVGKDFPVYLHPDSHEEYALARMERKTGRGYYGFEVDASSDVTLDEDLSRRDLTINAMAETSDGEIIDPYGGQTDLKQKILRHVSPAFVEDPLRVLRVARFAARFGFMLAPETRVMMQEIARGDELLSITPERVWLELHRALDEPQPQLFISTLKECGALDVLFPEIACLFGVPQPAKHHPEIDTGVHVCLALALAAKRNEPTEVRFAVLMHDLGKGTTAPDVLPSHHGHEERGVALVEAFCDRFKVPKNYRGIALLVTRHHLNIHRVREMRPAKILRLLHELDALRRPDRFELILRACEIDARGRGGDVAPDYPSAAFMSRAREVIASVDSRSLQGQGLSGESFRDALDEARLGALQAALA